jgi:hypothetical protein
MELKFTAQPTKEEPKPTKHISGVVADPRKFKIYAILDNAPKSA